MDIIRELREEVRTLRNEVQTMKADIATLDSNTNDIDDDVAEFHRTHTSDIKTLTDEIIVMKDEIGAVRSDLMNKMCKCENIQKAVSVENTIAQNRIWRLYSNNFHQNLLFKNSNLLTQFSLLQSSPRTKP